MHRNRYFHYLSIVKKFAAIGLLVLLLFNWCGYRMVADWLQTKAEQRLQAVIEDRTFNPQQLVELSVVTNLPYTNDWLEWERCNGTIEISGIHYQYVERKLEKGKMMYRCLPNNDKQAVVAARDEFFQLVNNFNQQTDQKPASKSVVINNFIGDYDDAVIHYNTVKPEPENSENTWPSFVSTLVKRQILTPHQPPDC
jgi:hypothetical protein